MSYTNVKVSYVGTNQNEVDAEKKGVKPDFHEFDTKISKGEVKTNYDDLQTTWLADGENPPHRAPVGTNATNTTNNGGQAPTGTLHYAGYNRGSKPEEANFIRPNYNPRTGGYLKEIHMVHNGGDNGGNTAITHYGNSNLGPFYRYNDHPEGLYSMYTPVKNDSLIKAECQYTAYSTAGSYPIWQWSLFVDHSFVRGGFERHNAMGTLTIKHTVYLNSWGSGKQCRIGFGFNSYNASHTLGIYAGNGNDVGYFRYFSVTEYENANPYGPAVIRWSANNIDF